VLLLSVKTDEKNTFRNTATNRGRPAMSTTIQRRAVVDKGRGKGRWLTVVVGDEVRRPGAFGGVGEEVQQIAPVAENDGAVAEKRQVEHGFVGGGRTKMRWRCREMRLNAVDTKMTAPIP
jgi:hypothetical protein